VLLVPGVAAARRGQAYARPHDLPRARRDLADIVRGGGTSFELEQARCMRAALPPARR
jgi:hypothetical protein